MDWNATIGIATLALVGITGYYAWVTRRLLLENARANAFQREGFERQMEAVLRPRLFCALERSTSKLALMVVNASDQPGYDVDLLSLAVLHADELPLREFADRFVEPEHKGAITSMQGRLVDESFYCVFNHFVYAVFPPAQQVRVQFAPPVVSEGYYLLFQFRDSRGVNYAQTYWWFDRGDSGRFALGALDPQIIMRSPRLAYEVTHDGPKLKVSDRKGLPPDLLREFEPMFEASLPSGYAPSFSLGIEDVGKWTKL